MHPQDFTRLLKKVLLGQASRQEKETLHYLTEENEEQAALYREVCLRHEGEMETVEIEKAWCRHRARMKKKTGADEKQP